ncbi:hypothetical protein G9C98_008043 [Cotesia typhae]|uniref:Uncharacterized protein n=1 Tax=Cotesia typhae TaxID=2053667 RepID=A0A8J5UPE3_9HYME|nr:hypothetical protein G9C98_008043 [Cotesia typhae]
MVSIKVFSVDCEQVLILESRVGRLFVGNG